MRQIKILDIIGQLLISLYLLLLHDGGFSADGFFIWLFVLGAWQVASCLIHFLSLNRKGFNFSRKAYQSTLLPVLLFGFFILPVMLFIGPAMALWYFITCSWETIHFYLWKRPASFYK